MGTCIVGVEQQAVGAIAWSASTPSLEDLGQVNVNVPLDVDCLPLLEQDRGHITGLGEEDRDHL